MSNNFKADDICETCGEQYQDHSVKTLSCPNSKAYEMGQPWFSNTTFTKKREHKPDFDMDHVDHTNC